MQATRGVNDGTCECDVVVKPQMGLCVRVCEVRGGGGQVRGDG